MNEGAGTVAHDVSGNGNDATFCTTGSTPVWNSTGITFSEAPGAMQSCLDTPLTTWRSLFIYACPDPGAFPNTILDPTANWAVANGIFGATTRNDGIAFAGSPWGELAYSIIPSIFNFPDNYDPTYNASFIGGCHVFGISLGSSADGTLDQLSEDGVMLALQQQGTSAALAPTAGHYQIGCLASCSQDGWWLQGEVDYAVVSNEYATSQQHAAEAVYIQNRLAYRGSGQFPYGTGTQNSIIEIGDSLTAGWRGTSPGWYALLQTDESYQSTSLGITAMLAQDMAGLWPQRENAYFSPLAAKQYCHIWAGTNDLEHGFTPQQAWQADIALGQECVAAGGIPIIATMISREGLDTQKDTFNALIRAGWQAAGFAAIDDLGAIPQIGADGAWQNTTYFQNDGTHLTGPNGLCDSSSGYGIVCAAVSSVVNQLDTEAVHKRRPLPAGPTRDEARPFAVRASSAR